MPTALPVPTASATRRCLAALVVLAVVAVACGRDTTDIGSAAGAVMVTDDSVVVTTTTTTTTTTTLAPTSSTVPTSTAASDPHETFVANIRPEIEVLEAFEEPDGDPADLDFAVTNPTYWGGPLALMVTDRSDDGRWLEVQVPVRPNGTEAWIRIEDAELTSHRYRAEVVLSERSVRVWNGAELVAETGAVVGADRTPTPLGRYFVNDLVEKWEGSAYGPWILSLSAFSEALDTFAGGIPVIAIHGTNRPELIGGAHSNGCIRIPNEVITVLAETVPLGTPVDILA